MFRHFRLIIIPTQSTILSPITVVHPPSSLSRYKYYIIIIICLVIIIIVCLFIIIFYRKIQKCLVNRRKRAASNERLESPVKAYDEYIDYDKWRRGPRMVRA